jgi:hypothetical protein
MSEGRESQNENWPLRGLALSLIAVVFIAVWYGPWPSPCYRQVQDGPQHQQQTEGFNSPVAVGGQPSTNAAYYKCDEKDSDWWGVRIAAVVAAIGALQFFMFYFQWRVMRESLGDTKKVADAAVDSAKAAVAANRPWIKFVAKIDSDFADPMNGPRLHFSIVVENVGRSPAKNVNVWAAMACGGGVIRYTDAQDKITPIPFDFGFTIFPNDPAPLNRTGLLTHPEIEEALKGAISTGRVNVGVVVRATYEFIGGKGRTESWFAIDGPLLGMIDMRRLPLAQDRMNLRKIEGQDIAE